MTDAAVNIIVGGAVAIATAYFTYKLNKIGKVADATHTLVNSNMGVQLRLTAAVSRRLAALTRNKSDLAAAELADKMLMEHEDKQATVDAKDQT